jgi:hypothetical protein
MVLVIRKACPSKPPTKTAHIWFTYMTELAWKVDFESCGKNKLSKPMKSAGADAE